MSPILETHNGLQLSITMYINCSSGEGPASGFVNSQKMLVEVSVEICCVVSALESSLSVVLHHLYYSS